MKSKFLFLILLLFIACGKEEIIPQTTYFCPTGLEVASPATCIIPYIPPAPEPVQNKTLPQPKKLDTEGGKYILEKGNLYHNLSRWSMQEIIEGMALYDNAYHHLIFLPVEYPRAMENENVYLRNREKLYDPFYLLRSKQGSVTEEAMTVPLRIYVFDNPTGFITAIAEKKDDSKFKLLYPQLYEEWQKFNCTEFATCRDIKAVRCTRERDTLITWSYDKEPYDQIWRKIHYNMQSLNDFGRALDAFMKFYCTPV